MGKYSIQQVPPPQRPWKIHPIWRGIGCLIFLIGPFIAFAAADLLLRYSLQNGWFPIPPELSTSYTIPVISYRLNHVPATLVVTVILLLLGFAVIMIAYSIIYSIIGPRRSPLDAPPIRESPSHSRNRPRKVR